MQKKRTFMSLNYNPHFGGSTGGWLYSAKSEAKYGIFWVSDKEQIFEMPTGGAAVMLKGLNLISLARKEQCLALGSQLRTMKINNYQIYCMFPCEEVQLVHPNDGVFPEKVNANRLPVGLFNYSIGMANSLNLKIN
jgi:photosystem I subunit 2